MTEQNTKALYNSLLQYWKQNPDFDVEEWQVVDYRSLPLKDLFERLSELDFHLNKDSFVAFAQEYDTPEELAENLVEEDESEENEDDRKRLTDQLFLLVFELWRRLLPERRTLSILCDDLDNIISAYDENNLEQSELVESVLANLVQVVEDNSDNGLDPSEIFQSISEGCANDLESFLYDYIADLEDEENFSYAKELVEVFSKWVSDAKWFQFLEARILAKEDPEAAHVLIEQLINLEEDDFTFYLEILALLTQEGDEKTFEKVLRRLLNLATLQEDFVEILYICQDYFHFLDRESEEENVANLLEQNEKIPLDSPFNAALNLDSHLLLQQF